MFRDRKAAGKQLAETLVDHEGRHTLVLAVTRGGVPVAYEIARMLQAEFSIIIVRELPLPNNQKTGFGAIAEDGSMVILDYVAVNVPHTALQAIVETEKKKSRGALRYCAVASPCRSYPTARSFWSRTLLPWGSSCSLR